MTTVRPLTRLSEVEQAVLDAVMPIVHAASEEPPPRCPFCDHLVSKHHKGGCFHRVAMKYADSSTWWRTSGLCVCTVGVEDPAAAARRCYTCGKPIGDHPLNEYEQRVCP